MGPLPSSTTWEDTERNLVAETDAELVRRARTLDERTAQAAYRTLVDRHGRAVYNLTYRLLGNTADAEDISQESFLKAFQRLETFDLNRPFAPWLLRIAHNTAIDALRRAPPTERNLEQADVVVTNDPGPSDALERAELRTLLERGLDRVRPAYRAALVLRYQEGLGYADMSLVMGVPEGTAKTYVHRARRELADVLRAEGLVPADSSETPRLRNP